MGGSRYQMLRDAILLIENRLSDSRSPVARAENTLLLGVLYDYSSTLRRDGSYREIDVVGQYGREFGRASNDLYFMNEVRRVTPDPELVDPDTKDASAVPEPDTKETSATPKPDVSDLEAVEKFLVLGRDATRSMVSAIDTIKSNRLVTAEILSDMLKKTRSLLAAIDPVNGWLVFYKEREQGLPLSISVTRTDLASIYDDATRRATQSKNDPGLVKFLAESLVSLKQSFSLYMSARQGVLVAEAELAQAKSAQPRTVQDHRRTQRAVISQEGRVMSSRDALLKIEESFFSLMESVSGRIDQVISKSGTLLNGIVSSSEATSQLEKGVLEAGARGAMTLARRRIFTFQGTDDEGSGGT